ncbi:MAG TPA: lipocalin family protein [Methanocorpusculum sp.]|nr:lipocalin family protein [Methanocorpusculum sp.]
MNKIPAGLLVLVLFSAVMCAGCVSSTPASTDGIAGTWQWEHEDGDEFDLVYTFNADNTFTETWYVAGTKTAEMSYDGAWSFSDGKYKIAYDNGDEVIEGAAEFVLSADGKTLTDGLEITYFRI